MKIGERDVAIMLSEDGRQVLHQASVNVAERSMIWAYAQEVDDMGLWIRIAREDGDHVVLVRWEYVLTVDFPVGEPKKIGIKN